MEYDVDSAPGELDGYCSRADFVFNLAGVNRPKDQAEFMEGNFGFASTLLDTLERHGNTCPVMLSSSAQASLSGRFEGSVYGESKLAGEGLFREYSGDDRRAGAHLPLPQPLRQVVPPAIQLRPWPPSATPSPTAAPTP